MDNMIYVQSLKKSYRSFQLNIPEFRVKCGEIVGLIGKNGAGKTTFLDILLNRRVQDEGEVFLHGKEKKTAEGTEKIGFVVDGGYLDESLCAIEINQFMQFIYQDWNTEYFYELLNELSIDKTKRIKNLSKGMKMKLDVAVCLAHKPKLLILDEVTSGLDPAMRVKVIRLLKSYAKENTATVLFSTHIIADIEEIADRICLVKKGSIVLNQNLEEIVDYYKKEKNISLNDIILRYFEEENKDEGINLKRFNYN